MTNELRKQLWNALLDAELSDLYYRKLGLKYLTFDKWLKMMITIASSGTVASWLLTNNMELIWKSMAILTPIIAIIHQILNWSDLVYKISEVRGKWIKIHRQYKILWIKFMNGLSEQTSLRNFEEILREEEWTKNLEFQIPFDQNLLDRCYNELKKVRESREM